MSGNGPRCSQWISCGHGGLFVRKIPSLTVFEEGTPLGDFPADPAPLPGETVVTKQYASAFHGTSLAATLTASGIDTLFICGDRDERIQAANLLDLEAKCADVLSLATALALIKA